MYRAETLYTFQTTDKGHLSINVGTIVDVLTVDNSSSWVMVVDPLTGQNGLVPRPYVRRIDRYDALEEIWHGGKTERKTAFSTKMDKKILESMPPLPSTTCKVASQTIRIPPVLGFVMYDFVGENLNELSVFQYDLVQVIKVINAQWWYVRLQLPNCDISPEGLVPRSYIQVQQLSRTECA